MTDLKPGRELDALIAEKVMGWHAYEDSNPKKTFTTVGDDSEHPCKICGTFYGHGFPNYSTDISAAWEVVEKFKWAEPELKYSDEQHCWFFSLHKAANYPNETGVTAPHAICLAALQAVGEK